MSDISKITDHVYIGSRMEERDLNYLHDHSFKLIISMIGVTIPHEDLQASGCEVIFLKTYDTFLTPIPNRVLLKGVLKSRSVLQHGGKMLVYCEQGKRRSVTMAAAILIASGLTFSEVIKVIKERREVADPTRWYVYWRIKQFQKYWERYGFRHV